MKDKKGLWDSRGRETGTKKNTMPGTENEDIKKREKKERMDVGWGKRMGMLQKNKEEENGKGICRGREELKYKEVWSNIEWRNS
jgi:hypothetical protein